ncbi:DUF4244 domain-containing protein [Streptomyces aureoversilis]|uniref:DUF4244 domain-containing protein n=1 Tax=Streptomyces aureoversilis TaxID=67277 RepID=A0ABV9ZUW1_9ACTN
MSGVKVVAVRTGENVMVLRGMPGRRVWRAAPRSRQGAGSVRRRVPARPRLWPAAWPNGRPRALAGADAGMSTAEYAVGTVAACALAAVLYKVVTSGAVSAALQGLIGRALNAPF